MYLSNFIEDSINEGIGLRDVIFISGCKHNCENCFSKQTWNFNFGKLFDDKLQNNIINKVLNNPLLDGITLCGGDPFYSSHEVINFLNKLKLKKHDLTLWSYTGFTFEEIINSNNIDMINLLKMNDYLIDGKFINELKDLTLKFRGSKNQRIINVQKSLQLNKIILFKE